MAGPGFRGVREPPAPDAKQALIEELESASQAIPQFLREEVAWIDRRAKLFETGDYPDKGVTITENDLDEIASHFVAPVPVWIEHSDSPLELGYLTEVESLDGELFGTISLTTEANALVERSDARSLSIGLAPDLKTIREVSLVRVPRIASARLYHSEAVFSGALILEEDAKFWRSKYEESQRTHKMESHEATIGRFVKEGKMLPCEVGFAKALLSCTDAIEFDGGSKPITELLIAMVESRIPHGLFSELAPATGNNTPSTMLPEEAEFYRKNFPEIGLDEIADAR